MKASLSGRTWFARFAWLPVLVLGMVLAGCAAPSAAQPGAAIATSAPAVATQAPPTVAPMATTAPAVEPTMAPAAGTAMTNTVTSAATVMISKNEKLGDILTDDKGMSLYLYTKDSKNTSNCYDKCAVNWPPLLTAGAPQAGAGADATLLGTTARKDGSMQVTYNGWPVYYWIKDKQAGDATGQDVGGVWYVLNAKGEKVETPAAAATPSASGATVMISKNDKLGDILTDAKGMTLYLYTKDTKNTSTCYDKCATNWPPLLTEGQPTAGAGANATLLGTTTRTDGKMQVTYGGWPVYYWIKDQKAGDATGQDVGGVWYVLNAKGEKVETPGGATSSGGAAASAPAAGKTVKVSIKNFSFGSALTVPVGTTVVWTNEDDMTHTVTATNGAFDSGDLDKGGEFSFTFTKAGTFDYVCNFHSNMKGTITVTG